MSKVVRFEDNDTQHYFQNTELNWADGHPQDCTTILPHTPCCAKFAKIQGGHVVQLHAVECDAGGNTKAKPACEVPCPKAHSGEKKSSKEKASGEKESKENVSKEKASKEKVSEQEASKEKVSKEKASKEKVSKEEASKERRIFKGRRISSRRRGDRRRISKVRRISSRGRGDRRRISKGRGISSRRRGDSIQQEKQEVAFGDQIETRERFWFNDGIENFGGTYELLNRVRPLNMYVNV